MNKTDLVRQLTQVLGQRQEAEKAVNRILKTIRESVQSGEKVVLSGIGSLYPRIRKAQRRHNPKTMEPVSVPPKRVIKFIPSKDLFKLS
ncbi:MAG: integration host factor subunit beta [Elusimicrobia bacterium]|nr:integration host factor subunit beta [Elusimicrobiota bacterium]MBI3012214.1 integration host factor subunit beta [Elusimicrobiota bacterium]MBI4217691.1 integration host factor subunit beta [Elusimicrobiota bacterium]